jgi:3-dehydroquinate dehydratase-2
MSAIWVLSGPNLNRLGTREPEIYGSMTLAEIEGWLRDEFPRQVLDFRQTNDESELIGWLHTAVDEGADVVLNPAAFSHYSYALRDAVALVTETGATLIEVHLSNPQAREEFRHTSVISGVATGVIQGFGRDSYRLAIAQITQSK